MVNRLVFISWPFSPISFHDPCNAELESEISFTFAIDRG